MLIRINTYLIIYKSIIKYAYNNLWRLEEMKYLFEIRKERGFSHAELADLVGIAQSSLARYERGEMQPTIEVVKKIADVLNVSIDELLNGLQSNEWILKIKLAKEGVINVSGLKTSAEFSVGDKGIAITLSGSYELWADDTNFEKVIEQMRQKRASALKFYKENF